MRTKVQHFLELYLLLLYQIIITRLNINKMKACLNLSHIEAFQIARNMKKNIFLTKYISIILAKLFIFVYMSYKFLLLWT